MKRVEINESVAIGGDDPLLVIAGPCVIESEQLCMDIAGQMKEVCAELGLGYVFKASFDKANRTSINSFRGPGLDAGLAILQRVRDSFNVPVTTDIHDPVQAQAAAPIVDIMQIPAFLCRQTDLLLAAANTGRVVNVKKGQFLAAGDMRPAAEKVRDSGNDKILLTERGTTFGYHNLVVDMRGLSIMRDLGHPVVFDATHSVQLPGGQGDSTGGQREFVPSLLRAAAAVGIDGVFMEVHPTPDTAKSDGPNAVPLAEAASILRQTAAIHQLVRS